jgi:hypothetical protein
MHTCCGGGRVENQVLVVRHAGHGPLVLFHAVGHTVGAARLEDNVGAGTPFIIIRHKAGQTERMQNQDVLSGNGNLKMTESAHHKCILKQVNVK